MNPEAVTAPKMATAVNFPIRQAAARTATPAACTPLSRSPVYPQPGDLSRGAGTRVRGVGTHGSRLSRGVGTRSN